MYELKEDTKKIIQTLLNTLNEDTYSSASQMSFYNLVSYNKSIITELFSQNIDEYIYLMVAKHVSNMFLTGLKKTILDISEILVESQEGQIIKNPEPYDLKFKLKNGKEYWIEIKNDIEQKNSAQSLTYYLYINEGKITPNEKDELSESDFWELVSGTKNAENELFKIINGASNQVTISSIIRDTHKRLHNEWKMQD